LPVQLPLVDADAGAIACHVVEIEANVSDGDSCDCAIYGGLANAGAGATARAYAELKSRGFCGELPITACERYCVCELPPLTGDALASCQNDAEYAGADSGYCYVDPAQGVGSLDAVAMCPPGSKRTVRLVGTLPTLGGSQYVDCAEADQ